MAKGEIARFEQFLLSSFFFPKSCLLQRRKKASIRGKGLNDKTENSSDVKDMNDCDEQFPLLYYILNLLLILSSPKILNFWKFGSLKVTVFTWKNHLFLSISAGFSKLINC